MEIKLYCSFFK